MHIRNLIINSFYFIILTAFFAAGVITALKIEEYIRFKVDTEVTLRLNSREKHTTIVAPTNIYERGYYSPGEGYDYSDEEGPHPQGKAYSDEDESLSGKKPTDLIR